MTAKKSVTPDVLVANERTVFLFNPLTSRAKEWIDGNVQPDAHWFGTTLVVEHRYAWGLAQVMKDAGLVLTMKRLAQTVTRAFDGVCTNRPGCPCDFCVTVREEIATGRDTKTEQDRIESQFIRHYEDIMTQKRRAVRFVEEMEGQDSPVLAVLKYYRSPLTREEYLAVSYLGEVDPEEGIPEDVEETFPEQFRRRTLLETPPASEKVH